MGKGFLVAAMATALTALSGVVAAHAEGTDYSARVVAVKHAALEAMAQAPVGDKNAVLEAISASVAGVEMDLVAESLCQLNAMRGIEDAAGEDPAAQARAHETMRRQEVVDALAESCQIARLTVAAYGASGPMRSVIADGTVGHGGYGAPGGGGGSGYVRH